MVKLNKNEITNFILASTVLLACVYVAAAIIGFQYGYTAALKTEFPNLDASPIVTHGTAMIDRILAGIIVCSGFSFFYLMTVLREGTARSIRVAILLLSLMSVLYTLYYKYLVFRRTGTPGFLNPYEDLFVQATILEALCVLLLAWVVTNEILTWRHESFTMARNERVKF